MTDPQPWQHQRPWWTWPLTAQTGLWLYAISFLLLVIAWLILSRPFYVEVPCTRASATVLGVNARVDATCVYSWRDGLFGPTTLDIRDSRVSFGFGRR